MSVTLLLRNIIVTPFIIKKKGQGVLLCTHKLWYNKSTIDVKGSMIVNRLKLYLKPYLKEDDITPLFKLFSNLSYWCRSLWRSLTKGLETRTRPYILSRGYFNRPWNFRRRHPLRAQYYAAKAATGFYGPMRPGFSKNSISFSQLDALKWHFTDAFDERYEPANGLNIALRLLLRSPLIVVGDVMAFIEWKCGRCQLGDF